MPSTSPCANWYACNQAGNLGDRAGNHSLDCSESSDEWRQHRCKYRDMDQQYKKAEAGRFPVQAAPVEILLAYDKEPVLL